MFKLLRRLTLLLAFGALTQPASAQNQSSMERMLNVLDRPSAWNDVPVSGAPPSPVQGVGQMMQPSMFGGLPNRNTGMAMPFGAANGSGGMGGPPGMPGGLFSRQNILRTMFGGSPSGANSSQDNSAKSANTQDNLSTALNYASQARNDCERASYGDDKGSRMSAAESARYAASSARAAADRATSAASGGNSYANDLAAQARNAADEAQASADRATANAENFVPRNNSGW